MEALFDLLGNPVMIFIIIGIISSLFNKAKGVGQDQQQRRQVRPPGKSVVTKAPVEGNRGPRPVPRPVQGRTAPQAAMKTEQKPEKMNDIQKAYQERKREAETLVNNDRTAGSGRLSRGTEPGSNRPLKEDSAATFQFEPSQDRLIEGLIWAEVLGKPRSKKPYRTGSLD